MSKINHLALIPVVDRLISAYETSQRIALERAEIEAKFELGKRAIALKEKELDVNYKLALRTIEQGAKVLNRHLDGMAREVAAFEAHQKELRMASRRLMAVICSPGVDTAARQQMIDCWNAVEENIVRDIDHASARINGELAASSRVIAVMAKRSRLGAPPVPALGRRRCEVPELEEEES